MFVFFISACIENAPMDSLSPEGPYARTIDDLPKDSKSSFIETKEVRIKAAGEMLNSQRIRSETKYNIDTIKMGLGDSAEFKGV